MAANLLGILIIEFHDELSQLVALADALLQLATDEGQLEVEIVGMAGLQVVQQRRHADALVIIIIGEVVDGEVDHRQESIGVYPVHLTGLSHRLVAKPQVDAKAAKCLQHTIIILDERDHLVLWLIHLQVLHCSLYTLLNE